MKILITTDLFTTDTNGVVTSTKNLFDVLKKRGHDVRVLTVSDTTKSRRDGDVYYIRSVTFPIYPDIRMPISYRHRLMDELIEWCPDVIHSQCEFFSFFFARRISKLTGAPIVHTYHTMYEQYVKYVFPSARLGCFVLKKFLRKCLKRVRVIIAPTKKVERSLIEHGLQNKICVIPSGISLDQHKNRLSGEERTSKRRELGIGDDETVLINLGRLGNEKNIGELLRYFAKASAATPSLRFLIVGGGPAKEDLERESKELGISDRVIFTGMVSPASVHEYYQLGDIFVSASTSETQGLTYVEAAANGLPLLCRRDPCLEDVLINGDNGYDYETEEEFIARLTELISAPEMLAEAGRRSAEIANRYDKTVFGDSVIEVYGSVVGNSEEILKVAGQ